MNLENQQVNLELSQQLKEAGYPQDGLWWWDLRRKKEDCDVGDKPEDEWILSYEECYQGDRNDLIVAPTVAELGERLPNTGKISSVKINKWYCSEIDSNQVFEADSEANARAKMWLYLKKENLL